jgi:hypothetical protein
MKNNSINNNGDSPEVKPENQKETEAELFAAILPHLRPFLRRMYPDLYETEGGYYENGDFRISGDRGIVFDRNADPEEGAIGNLTTLWLIRYYPGSLDLETLRCYDGKLLARVRREMRGSLDEILAGAPEPLTPEEEKRAHAYTIREVVYTGLGLPEGKNLLIRETASGLRARVERRIRRIIGDKFYGELIEAYPLFASLGRFTALLDSWAKECARQTGDGYPCRIEFSVTSEEDPEPQEYAFRVERKGRSKNISYLVTREKTLSALRAEAFYARRVEANREEKQREALPPFPELSEESKAKIRGNIRGYGCLK